MTFPSRLTLPEPPPARFNMAAYCIGRAAREAPDKIALLVVDDPDEAAAPAEVWTYREIEDAVLRVAGGLREAGLLRGDRLLIRLDNTSTYALLFFGAIAAGLVPLPTSTQLTDPEALFLLADSGARAIALADGLPLQHLPPGLRVLSTADIERMAFDGRKSAYADTGADDPAFLIYTSGTTAHPKGVLHAQRSAWGRRPMVEGWYGLTREDRVLHAGAFNWTYTLGTGLTDPWANGATSIVFTGEKRPELWPRLIRETGATIFAAVPSLYRQILKYGLVDGAGSPREDVSGVLRHDSSGVLRHDLGALRHGLGALRHGLIAGETPPPGLFEDWFAATGLELYEALGMSEVSTYVSSSPTVPRKPGRVGKPQAGRHIAILPVDGGIGDDGETPLAPGEEGLLAVHRSDPGLMLGYWKRPEEEAEVYRGEWFVGGDLAMIDADGYVAHLGRANDVMKALGYRVSPQEVEAVLARCPGVAEVACREVEVREGVHVVGAFVVPSDAGRPPAPEAIKAFAAERLAAYKCPREVYFVASLARTANGKVKRSALKPA